MPCSGRVDPKDVEIDTLKARVAELEANSVRHAEEIDEWKEASGIVTGSGDPADVTPTMASAYWRDIDRDLTISQIKVEGLEVELRMAKVGDEVGHKLLDVSIEDGAEKVTEILSLRARVADLEVRKESAIVNMGAASEYLERVESLLGSASLMIGKVSDADALAWMDRYYMRQRIRITDQTRPGKSDGETPDREQTAARQSNHPDREQ